MRLISRPGRFRLFLAFACIFVGLNQAKAVDHEIDLQIRVDLRWIVHEQITKALRRLVEREELLSKDDRQSLKKGWSEFVRTSVAPHFRKVEVLEKSRTPSTEHRVKVAIEVEYRQAISKVIGAVLENPEMEALKKAALEDIRLLARTTGSKELDEHAKRFKGEQEAFLQLRLKLLGQILGDATLKKRALLSNLKVKIENSKFQRTVRKHGLSYRNARIFETITGQPLHENCDFIIGSESQ